MATAPQGTTPSDLITLALKQAGAVGVGQTPLAQDMNDSFMLLNMMLGQWNRRRWLIYHEVDVPFTANGQQSYTLGPGGQIAYAYRPDRLEGAFFRYIQHGPAPIGETPGDFSLDASSGDFSVSQAIVPVTGGLRDQNQDFSTDFGQSTPQDPDLNVGIDYPLQLIQSREDYSTIAFKTLGENTPGFPQMIFYDPAFPVGKVYVWPVPSSQFEIHLLMKEELAQLPSISAAINLPNEYLEAILYNLAMRLAGQYGSEPMAMVPGLARAALNTIRTANAQVPLLDMPAALERGGVYNPYSDTYR